VNGTRWAWLLYLGGWACLIAAAGWLSGRYEARREARLQAAADADWLAANHIDWHSTADAEKTP
jgi:hypothetical protein